MQSTPLLSSAARLLKEYWGYDAFRPEQIAPIISLCEGKDALAIMSTGAGKSICFQVPGLHRGGLCLVISPLIALMIDQVDALKSKGIAAAFISSDSGGHDMDRILNNAVFGGLQFLYVSPERLKHPVFLARIERMDVRTIAVDEAHCISQWGHDFRPSYREIRALRPMCPLAVWGAFTATATAHVADDIATQLSMSSAIVHRASMRRSNLMFGVYTLGDSERMLLESVRRMRGAGLVYSGTRHAAAQIAQRLAQLGVKAEAYHAGLSSRERQNRQKRWMEDKTQVLTCTSAFGMGVDKGNVRWVFHAHVPTDMESYLQEAGRAGRDGQPSTCMLFPSSEAIDAAKNNAIVMFPPLPFIQSVYQGLANQGSVSIGDCPEKATPFDMETWMQQHKASRKPTESSLRLLQKEGLIEWQTIEPSDDMRFKLTPALERGLKTKDSLTTVSIVGHWIVRHANEAGCETRFSLDALSRGSQQSETDVKEAIHQFDAWGWIERVQPTSALSIAWKTARIRSESLTISKELLETRRIVAEAKWKIMEKYLESSACKALSIEGYFGHHDLLSCGVCDACRADKILNSMLDLPAIPPGGLRITEWLWQFPLIEHQKKMKELAVLREADKVIIQGDCILPRRSD
ncbi:MAG: RecQ family ATP-dependent DNA helicase [Bacteroidetes bacterium]|nr:RecQ family ATP-dependent DNA helicase [Bacteroidota bacterium]